MHAARCLKTTRTAPFTAGCVLLFKPSLHTTAQFSARLLSYCAPQISHGMDVLHSNIDPDIVSRDWDTTPGKLTSHPKHCIPNHVKHSNHHLTLSRISLQLGDAASGATCGRLPLQALSLPGGLPSRCRLQLELLPMEQTRRNRRTARSCGQSSESLYAYVRNQNGVVSGFMRAIVCVCHGQFSRIF